MTRLWTFWGPPTLLHHPDRIAQSAAVGQRAGVHDAALCHDVWVRRGFAQFGPQHLDAFPLALSAEAVRQHRVMFKGVLLGHDAFKGAGRSAEKPQAVHGEPKQFLSRHPVGRLGDDGPQDRPSIAITLLGERHGRDLRTVNQAGHTGGWNQLRQVARADDRWFHLLAT